MPKVSFNLGTVVATPAAVELLDSQQLSFINFLHRHSSGDWGDVNGFDAEINNNALRTGGRLLSSYATPQGKLWIITEADRSVTTLMLPEDY